MTKLAKKAADNMMEKLALSPQAVQKAVRKRFRTSGLYNNQASNSQ